MKITDSTRRRTGVLAVLGAAGAIAGGLIVAVASADERDSPGPVPSSVAFETASRYVQAALEASGSTVDLGRLESLGEAATGETMFKAPSADGSLVCFLVVDPPDAGPAAGTSVACGPQATVKGQGQQVWRDNPDGSISLWLLAPEAPDGKRRAEVQFDGRSLTSTPAGVLSTRVPAGVARVRLVGPSSAVTLGVPGR